MGLKIPTFVYRDGINPAYESLAEKRHHTPYQDKYVDWKGVDLSAMLNAGLIGGILVGSVAVLGAFYYYNETKHAEKEAQLLARLDAKDEQMLARLDAKDVRFEAFVERVLAATRPAM